jgi:2-oxoglutarate ferredoxin oxidoreductase subunit delta
MTMETDRGNKVNTGKSKENSSGFHPVINQLWCKRCGICVTVCPKKILVFNSDNQLTVTDPDSCIGCSMCENICPDFAIEIYQADEPGDSQDKDPKISGTGEGPKE